MKRKTTAVVAWALMILMLQLTIASATLISPPQQVQLDGGGEDATGDWVGGYWTFTVSVDQADSLVGKVSLPANTTVKGENGTEMRTRKTVDVQIEPQKAYYRRLLKLAPVEDRIVSPKTYRAGMNRITGFVWYDASNSIDPVVVPYYEWAEPGWEKYTMFKASIYVEGQLLGETSFNTEKGVKDLVVDTSKGKALIKNLGRLEGDYTEPQMPSIVLFNDKHIYTSDAIQYVRYDHGRQSKWWGAPNSYLTYIEGSRSFSTYWWGTVRWNPASDVGKEVGATPAPFNNPGALGYDAIAPGKGWASSDDLFNLGRTPVKPEIFEGSDSLIAYLNRMTSEGNIADTWLTGYSWHIEYSGQTPNAVIVDIPWGAYSGNPLVTFYVPSELADTWVYRPPIANVKIENATWANGSDIGAADTKTCILDLKQYAAVNSSATIYAETSTPRASVSPTSTTVTMGPNEEKTVAFEVSNLGVDSDSGGSVLFTVKRTWDGVTTDETKLDFTLLAPVLPDNMTDVIDRTKDPNSKKDDAGDKSENILLIVAIVACTGILATCATVVIRDESKRKKAKELAVKAAHGTAGLAKTVARPLWQRYKIPLAAIIVGAIFFLGGILWQAYSPIKILPLKTEIFGVTLLSTSWETVISVLFGILMLAVGFFALVTGGTAYQATEKPVKLVIKTVKGVLHKKKK